MMALSDLLNLPEVVPVDLSATNGGLKQDWERRTKAEIRQQRAFDDAFKRIHDYQVWPLESIGAGHDLTQHRKDMASNRAPGGIQNMDQPVKRRGGLGRLLRVIGGQW